MTKTVGFVKKMIVVVRLWFEDDPEHLAVLAVGSEAVMEFSRDDHHADRDERRRDGRGWRRPRIGHGHAHDHSHHVHGAGGDTSLKALGVVLVLLVAFMVVQLGGGLIAGSLALVSDAGHMATDSLGVGMALVAMVVARRHGGSRQHTYGLHRLEILAALANAVLLCGIGAFVILESLRRFGSGHSVETSTVLVVGGLGLVVNLVAFAVLRPRAGDSLNMQGAYLEVLADLLGSVGVIISALLIAATRWEWIDPVAALVIGAVVVPRALRLGARAVRVLLEAAPSHLDVATVDAELRRLPGVVDVHDLHVWSLSAHRELVTAHLVVAADAETTQVLDLATRSLEERFGVDHATLQIERTDLNPCRHPGW